MSAPNLTDETNQDIPELGDILTLQSSVFGSVTGKIIYRDEKLIRVLSINASDRAYDLPLDLEDGDFDKSTGITKCTIHTKREYPHFALQLGAVEGEILEFLTKAGQKVSESGVIAQIIADDTYDAILLEDGRRMDFFFIGPPMPIEVVRVTTSITDETNEGEPQVPVKENDAPAYDLSFLEGLIPAAMVEEISTAQRTYPEGIQREEMYMDLLKSYPESKQKNPNLLRILARETELLIALKNAVISTNEKGEPRPFVKSADSLKDILDNLVGPVSSILPILAIKRILYADADNLEEVSNLSAEQVELRNWLENELRTLQLSNNYTAGHESRGQTSNLMYEYLYRLLNGESSVFLPNSESVEGQEVQIDQDALRTVLPPNSLLGYSKIPKAAKLDSSYVGKIESRHHRVIGSSKSRYNDIIASGDPGTPVNYLIFPVSVGSMWRPNKYSGSLAEDIRAANVVNGLPSIETITNDARSYNPNGVQVIKGSVVSEGEEQSTFDMSKWLANNLQNSVHPSDLLASGSIGINRVLDSIGLRSYEWTPEISNILWSAIRKAIKQYKNAFGTYSDSVNKYLETASPYNLGNSIPDDSTLYKKSMNIDVIANVVNKIGDVSSDLFLAQKILNSAEGTLAKLLYIGRDHTNFEHVRKVYLSEIFRAQTKFNTVNAELAKYKSAPIINTCPHVHDMDILRSVMKTDNSKFLAVLQKVLTRYQGARNNNWIECKVCNANLICIHEVMMLYELTHPGKAPALHKEILLEYGGAAFSGRYVCRYCGIAISEFEYDTSLEYDDEGKPLVGRNIIEEGEKTVEDELDSILNISVKKKAVSFDNPIKANLYEVARVMIQTVGFSFTDDNFIEIVDYTYNYISTELPPRDRYEAMIAKKKIKPSYESFIASNQIAITAAYVLCMLHSMSPIPTIIYPFPGCPFKLGGYPIDTDNVDDLGAMEYFVCAIANINRDLEPWNISLWSTETSPDKRKLNVRGWIDNMMKGPVHVMLSQAKNAFKSNLKDIQERASSSDIIPSYYRPTPNRNPAIFESEIMVHPDRVLTSAQEDNLALIEPLIEQRSYQLACGSVTNAHGLAISSGIINEMSQRSESVCCFAPIQSVRQGVVSVFNPPAVEDEISVLRLAETIIHKRDPCQQSNGTHLYVHWSSPEALSAIKVAPDSSYFKLFMRTCFKGPRVGEKHEFGRRSNNYVCRFCNFAVDVDPLILMSDLNDEELYNNDSKRKGPMVTVVSDKARSALEANGITVDSNSFNDLLAVVRSKNLVAPFVEHTASSSEQIFEHLNRLVNTECPFLAKRSNDWATLVNIMSVKRDSEPSKETRIIAWAPFVTMYDSLRSGLLDILDGRQSRGTKPIPKKIEDVLKAVERITSEPKYQGANEINKHWIVGLERISQSFDEMLFGGTAKKFKTYFTGKRWFGSKISQRHAEKFETMIHTILGATEDTTKLLGNGEIKNYCSEITHKLATYLGRIFRFWSNEMPSFSMFGVSTEELQYMLRWIVFSSIETLLLTDSPLYKTIPKDATKISIQKILLNWVKETFLESKRQFDLFGLTDEEIQLAILDAREKEKISVINEIDDEKDPDLRAIIMIQKNLKIGRWAIGTAKNLSTYNAEFQDFLQEQRDRAGIADTGILKPSKEDALGFDMSNIESSAYDTAFAQDEDEGGAMED